MCCTIKIWILPRTHLPRVWLKVLELKETSLWSQSHFPFTQALAVVAALQSCPSAAGVCDSLETNSGGGSRGHEVSYWNCLSSCAGCVWVFSALISPFGVGLKNEGGRQGSSCASARCCTRDSSRKNKSTFWSCGKWQGDFLPPETCRRVGTRSSGLENVTECWGRITGAGTVQG